MPRMTLDENGFPKWESDEDPMAAAVAAMDSIGTTRPYPAPLPDMGPGAQPVGAPPADVPGNALMAPDGSYDHPSLDAVSLPEVGSSHPEFQNLSALGAPDEALAPVVQGGIPQDPLGTVQHEAGGTDYTIAHPAAAAAPAGRPARVSPLAAADAALTDAVAQGAQAQYDHGIATNEAARQLAERRAAVEDDHNTKQAANDAEYQANRQRAQADAEAQTAKWMASMEEQAKKEPNPKRWFASQSSFSKVLWLASLAFGTKAAATAPGVQNIGMAMIKEELDKDMAEQRARAAREMDVLKMKGQQIDKKSQQRLANLNDDHSIRTGQLLSLEKAAMERSMAPGSADDQVAMANAHQWLTTQRMTIAATKAQQAFTASESAAQRAHSAGMQRNAQEFEREQKNLDRIDKTAKEILDRKLAYDSLEMQYGTKEDAAAAAKAKAAREAADDSHTFDPKSTGLVLDGGKDANGKTVLQDLKLTGVKADKSVRDDVIKVTDSANAAYNDMTIIRDAVKNRTFRARMLNNDLKLRAAVTRLGYSQAKAADPRGIVTDADHVNGQLSALGVTMDGKGGIIYEAKTWLDKDAGNDDPNGRISKQLDFEINRMTTNVERKVNGMVDKEQGGGSIKWHPVASNPNETNVPTLSQADAALTGKSENIPMPKSDADFKKALKEEAAGSSDVLPPLSPDMRDALSAVEDDLKGRSVSSIEKIEQKVISKADGDERALRQASIMVTDAKAHAKEAEAAVKAALLHDRVGFGSDIPRERVRAELHRAGLGTMAQSTAYVDELRDAVKAAVEFDNTGNTDKLKKLGKK